MALLETSRRQAARGGGSVLNAPPGHLLSLAMVRELSGGSRMPAAVSGLRWLTIEGAGGQFSYGASIPEHLPERMREVLPATHALMRELLDFPAPTAALVEGRCLGRRVRAGALLRRHHRDRHGHLRFARDPAGGVPAGGRGVAAGARRRDQGRRAIDHRRQQLAGEYWHQAGLVSVVPEPLRCTEAARAWFAAIWRRVGGGAVACRAGRAGGVAPAVERAIEEGERAISRSCWRRPMPSKASAPGWRGACRSGTSSHLPGGVSWCRAGVA